jgi:hypothetical protein
MNGLFKKGINLLKPLGLVLLGVIIVLGYQKLNEPSPLRNNALDGVGALSNDATRDWKTYKNDFFRLIHPPEIKVEEKKASDKRTVYLVQYIGDNQDVSKNPPPAIIDSYIFSVERIDQLDKAGTQTHIREAYFDSQVNCGFSDNISKIEPINYAGEEGWQYSVIEDYGDYTVVYVEHAGQGYKITRGFALVDKRDKEEYLQKLKTIDESFQFAK